MENETISRVFVLRKLKDMDIRPATRRRRLVQRDLRDVPAHAKISAPKT
jgi:hypothetical protein